MVRGDCLLTLCLSLAAAECKAQGRHPRTVFTVVSINGRPLPFIDSVTLRGTLQPVQEFRAWRLELSSPDSGTLVTTYKDFVMAGFPCEVQREMRESLAGNGSVNVELSEIADTTSKGCDDLSIVTLSVPLHYKQIGDSVHLMFRGDSPLVASTRGDTLRLVLPDEPPKVLLAVRAR